MRLIAKRCTTTLVTLPTEWESPVGGRGFAQQESQLVFGQQELTQAKVSRTTNNNISQETLVYELSVITNNQGMRQLFLTVHVKGPSCL